MNKKNMATTNGKRGGNLVGKPHKDKQGNDVGGIKAVVTDANGRPVELEGGEVIINKEASKKHWKELSRINQSAGGGVPIDRPIDPHDEDPQEYAKGGKIQFNPNQIPNKWILKYAQHIKKNYPEIWKKGGNIFGNQAFVNLERVAERGNWLDSEEWMYIKWRSYVARHKADFRIEGVVAMLKWVDKVDKGWQYMKNLIEDEIKKSSEKKGGWNVSKEQRMSKGGELEKGIKTEMEHKDTIDKFKRKGVSDRQVAKSIAKDHLEEDSKYYSKLSNIESMANGGALRGVKNKSFVVFFKSNLLDNIVYTNVDSDSLENAIKTQKSTYNWSDIQWIKGFEQKDANNLQEFFLQNIKQKWETKSELLVKIKDDKIIFSRNVNSVAFDFMPMFEIKENERVFKEAYLTNENVEIYIDSDFNFDRNKIFELILNKMAKGGTTTRQQAKIGYTMREFKEGKLKTSYGETVTDEKQALAIALSKAGIEKKEYGGMIEIGLQGFYNGKKRLPITVTKTNAKNIYFRNEETGEIKRSERKNFERLFESGSSTNVMPIIDDTPSFKLDDSAKVDYYAMFKQNNKVIEMSNNETLAIQLGRFITMVGEDKLMTIENVQDFKSAIDKLG
jgi:hypothetical protein